jgi:hypothetical protein
MDPHRLGLDHGGVALRDAHNIVADFDVGGEPQMTEQTFLLVCVVAILFYIGWKFDQNKKHKEKLRLERERLTDEAVIQAQMEFEKRLEANVLLPDGIWRKEAFIYWQLMRKWFASLLASSRYGGSSDKIKSDWLQYMHLMEERAMYVFLSSEAPDEKQVRGLIKEQMRHTENFK